MQQSGRTLVDGCRHLGDSRAGRRRGDAGGQAGGQEGEQEVGLMASRTAVRGGGRRRKDGARR